MALLHNAIFCSSYPNLIRRYDNIGTILEAKSVSSMFSLLLTNFGEDRKGHTVFILPASHFKKEENALIKWQY